MLKTMGREERLERYIKMNPREVKPFTREDARKLDLGKVQTTMHGGK